jgi:hypothetical protein
MSMRQMLARSCSVQRVTAMKSPRGDTARFEKR